MNRRSTFVLASAALLALGLSGCSGINRMLSGETRDEGSGTITDGGTTDVFQLRVGDCLSNEVEEKATQMSKVATVPCSVPHTYEVFQNLTMADADGYPGDEAADKQAMTGCIRAFETFTGIAYQDSTYDFSDYYPSQESWSGGDRSITCLIADPNGPSAGSLAGIAA